MILTKQAIVLVNVGFGGYNGADHYAIHRDRQQLTQNAGSSRGQIHSASTLSYTRIQTTTGRHVPSIR